MRARAREREREMRASPPGGSIRLERLLATISALADGLGSEGGGCGFRASRGTALDGLLRGSSVPAIHQHKHPRYLNVI